MLTDGERKSIEPMSRRVTLPPELTSAAPEQALRQFVNQSPWDQHKVLARYRALMAQHFASPEGVFVLDAPSFPKRCSDSVGASHQYCGALGKRANCQVAVTLHYLNPRGHFLLGVRVRVHLPESWTGNGARMNRAGVPEGFHAHRTKGEIALGLIDEVRHEGLADATVIADVGYGSAAVRAGVTARGRRYVLGTQAGCLVFPQESSWVHLLRTGRRGPSPSSWVLAPNFATTGFGRSRGAGPEIAARVVAVRHQGEDVGPIRLDAGVARPGLEHGRLCSR